MATLFAKEQMITAVLRFRQNEYVSSICIGYWVLVVALEFTDHWQHCSLVARRFVQAVGGLWSRYCWGKTLYVDLTGCATLGPGPYIYIL